MIIVGLKPAPQTQYKFLKPKASAPGTAAADNHRMESMDSQQGASLNLKLNTESLAGCLAWLPVTKTNASATQDVGKGKSYVPWISRRNDE